MGEEAVAALEEIDTSTIEELSRLKAEQEVLEERLDAMEERREKVSQVVYERVRHDYEERHHELEEEARPLKERARAEYGRLAKLHRSVEEGLREATLAREEIEFRHGLGEFAKKEYEERIAGASEAVEARERELAQAEELRQRFVDAFRSEDDLAAEPGADVEDEPSGITDVQPVLAGLEEEGEEAGEESGEEDDGEVPAAAAESAPEADASEPDDLAGEEELPSVDDDSTRWEDEPATAMTSREDDWHTAATGVLSSAEAVPAAPPPEPPGEEPEQDEEAEELTGATRFLAQPKVVLYEGDRPGRSIVLNGEQMSIGRSADNQIHLLEESISRRHAELRLGADGWVLHDLGSENGSYVNGERIREHALRNGDVIHLGIRKLVFQEG